MNKLSREDKIYIAGLFDGEGCVCFSRDRSVRSGGDVAIYHRIIATVAMTHLDTIRWLGATVGCGNLKFIKRKKPRKAQLRWQIEMRDACKFLHKIYPYLKTKKLQAEIAFKYEATMAPLHSGFKPLSKQTFKIREQLCDDMHKLNNGSLYKRNYADFN